MEFRESLLIIEIFRWIEEEIKFDQSVLRKLELEIPKLKK